MWQFAIRTLLSGVGRRIAGEAAPFLMRTAFSLARGALGSSPSGGGGGFRGINFDVKVYGLAELHAALDALPDKIQENLMRGGLRAGARVFADGAKIAAPDATGLLRRSIRVSVRADRRRGAVVATIKAGGGRGSVITSKGRGRVVEKRQGAFYARFVEKGTRPHTIKPRGAKALAIGKTGVTVEVVRHPGARARPFMANTFDRKHALAIQALADYLRRRLPEVARQVRRDPPGLRGL